MVPNFHPDTDALVGTQFAGKYRIVRRIGNGGMGAVYLAHHILLERTVAIKVVHSRWAQTDPACLQRFRTEARASSCLNHPNVMSVFDFGITDDGTAYLVMDYIPGEGLDEVLRREKRLETKRALHIFTQACDALAHAHEQGVVHRDLKPSNIMLLLGPDGQETVKIVDFGIAKILPGRARNVDSCNDDGEIIGSPLYMSPEQCVGNAQDGRSDIYSLGCLLYEALTGQPPITDRNVLGIIYRHINELPPRFLSVAPQLAIAPQIEAVVLKALQKRPSDRHQDMRVFAEELRRAYQHSQDALHSFGYEVEHDPEYERAAGRGEQLFPDSSDSGDPVEQAFLRKLHAATAGSEPASQEVVALLHHVAEFYLRKGESDRAESYLRAAVERLVGAWGPWDPRVGESVKKLADFYREGLRYEDAEPLYLDLLTVKRKTVGQTHPDIACILLRLADLYLSTSHLTHARRYYQQCLKVSEQLFGENDPILTPVLTGLATVYGMQNERAESEALYTRALSIKEGQFGPDHYEIAATLLCLGVIYRQQELYKEAERVFGRALTIYEQSAGPSHSDVCTTLLLLAEMYSAQGADPDAEALYKRTLTIRLCQDGESDLSTAQAYEMYAVHHIRRQRFEEAEVMYREALSIKEKALEPDHVEIASSLGFLATLYHAQHCFEQAEEHYKKAIDIMRAQKRCAQMLAETLRSLGDLYAEQKRYAEAEPVYLRALEGQGKSPDGHASPQARAIVNSLANLYSAANGSNTLTKLRPVKSS